MSDSFKTVTVQEVEQDILDNPNAWLRMYDFINIRNGYRKKMVNNPLILDAVYFYGKWIDEKLKGVGVKEEQREEICFIVGRLMFMTMKEGKTEKFAFVVSKIWNLFLKETAQQRMTFAQKLMNKQTRDEIV